MMLEHNFMQFWVFILSIASTSGIFAILGLIVYALFFRKKPTQPQEAKQQEKFTCAVCKQEIVKDNLEKNTPYKLLKKIGLCEVCLNNDKAVITPRLEIPKTAIKEPQETKDDKPKMKEHVTLKTSKDSTPDKMVKLGE